MQIKYIPLDRSERYNPHYKYRGPAPKGSFCDLRDEFGSDRKHLLSNNTDATSRVSNFGSYVLIILNDFLLTISERGRDSKEKLIQAERQRTTMPALYTPGQEPYAPAEPDAPDRPDPGHKPAIIPIEDTTSEVKVQPVANQPVANQPVVNQPVVNQPVPQGFVSGYLPHNFQFAQNIGGASTSFAPQFDGPMSPMVYPPFDRFPPQNGNQMYGPSTSRQDFAIGSSSQASGRISPVGNSPNTRSGQRPTHRNVCRHFAATQTCRFGDNCKFEHILPDGTVVNAKKKRRTPAEDCKEAKKLAKRRDRDDKDRDDPEKPPSKRKAFFMSKIRDGYY